MTKREPFLTIEEIREKCEQYWNERGVLDEELHSILSFIHVRASKLNAAFESAVAEREKALRERIEQLEKELRKAKGEK